MQQRYDVTPVVNVSRGKIESAYVIKVVGTDRWRSLFDLTVDGKAPDRPALLSQAGRQDAHRDLALSVFPVKPNSPGMPRAMLLTDSEF